jgi:hypothetical protein
MEPLTYRILRCAPGTQPEEVDWAAVPAARIATYRWMAGGYEPAAEARMVFVPGFGFILRMHCQESHPKAVYTAYNQPVYTDSCLEFFAAWVAGDPRYMNMEMNARGTLLSCLGPGRGNRIPVADLTGGQIPAVTGSLKEDGYPQGSGSLASNDGWHVTALIPTALLARIYGVPESHFGPGMTFRGNFYKCGDETPIPHYGMWNPVDTEKPDFHRPEFFGTFLVE